MTEINTLIFDLDNTLINRDKPMRQAIAQWLQHHDAPTCTLDEIMAEDNSGYTDRTFFFRWLLQTLGPGNLPYNTPDALQTHLLQQLVTFVEPNPDVNSMLEALQPHYRLVLATNGSSAIQRGKLKQSNLEQYFAPEHLFISGEIKHEKPDPAFFTILIDRLQLNPAEALMTGDDTVKDIKTAHSCGLLTCWVSRGSTAPANLPANIIIPQITALPEWLN